MNLIVGMLFGMLGGAGVAVATSPPQPVKVFILAGQSNMEGHARVETFDYIGDDPATAPLLKQMRNPDGTPRVCDRVWISYLTGENTVKEGKLTAGYGALGRGPKIGPEFTFGLRLEEKLSQPVLLIKTAWGGKSLHTDFRSPDGPYYRQMIDHVRMVLKDIQRIIPEYDPKQGYEIAGFVWLQGWNDMVDAKVYPKRAEPGGYDLYSELLAKFIRDVRKDLNAPEMPFVIGVMGVGGVEAKGHIVNFREAMAAPARLPEFKGRVVAVPTAPFWDARLGAIDEKRGKVAGLRRQLGKQVEAGKLTKEEAAKQVKELEEKLISTEEAKLWERGASNAGYHYLGCAKTFALMGRAFADALLPLQRL
jgi:alpha-galactosidase